MSITWFVAKSERKIFTNAISENDNLEHRGRQSTLNYKNVKYDYEIARKRERKLEANQSHLVDLRKHDTLQEIAPSKSTLYNMFQTLGNQSFLRGDSS